MSAGIYADINGVTRKGKKLYAKVNGVVRPIKEMWVKVNGVSRCVYKNAITWTYEMTTKSVSDDDTCGVSDYTTYLFHRRIKTSQTYNKIVVTYTFNGGDGFLVHSGQTIRLDMSYTDTGLSSNNLWIEKGGFYVGVNITDIDGANNSKAIINAAVGEMGSTGNTAVYNFTSDTQVKTIQVFAYVSVSVTYQYQFNLYGKLYINSDNGLFLLNNSGKSN